MKINETDNAEIAILSLSGKILGASDVEDIHNSIKTILDKSKKNIIIDLTNVYWMGSVGIGILICCMTTVRNAGGEMKLAGLSDKMEQILKITKLDGVFEIYQDSDQAIASFN